MIDHHMPRSSGRAARYRLCWLVASAAAGGLLLPSPASPQARSVVPDRPRAATPASGLPALSRRVNTLLQMAPYHQLNRALIACSSQAIFIFQLQADIDAARAEQLILSGCDQKADDLRSLLARRASVPEAAVFYRRYRQELQHVVRDVWAKRQVSAAPPAPTKQPVTAPRRMDNWLLEPAPGGCQATYEDPNNGTSTVGLYQAAGDIHLVVKTKVMSLGQKYDSAWLSMAAATPSGRTDFTMTAQVRRESGYNIYDTRLGRNHLEILMHSQAFRMEDAQAFELSTMKTGRIFYMGPIAPILDTLRRC